VCVSVRVFGRPGSRVLAGARRPIGRAQRVSERSPRTSTTTRPKQDQAGLARGMCCPTAGCAGIVFRLEQRNRSRQGDRRFPHPRSCRGGWYQLQQGWSAWRECTGVVPPGCGSVYVGCGAGAVDFLWARQQQHISVSLGCRRALPCVFDPCRRRAVQLQAAGSHRQGGLGQVSTRCLGDCRLGRRSAGTRRSGRP
jgi:hypothetical protein